MRKLTFNLLFLCPILFQVFPGRALEQNLTRGSTRHLLSGGEGQKPFDVTRHAIPLNEIDASGPPRDGIHALLHPKFVKPGQVSPLLKESDRVLGVLVEGDAKAYPVKILNYHELVNDFLGGKPILVSW
jgi:hypothetical protein